jgi:lysozyme family protein
VSGFRSALAITLRYEGGYVNDPDDRGGATNYGVTQDTYDAWRIGQGLDVRPVRKIEHTEAQDIYFQSYWIKGNCEALPWPLNAAHFDACVNHGVAGATRILQRAVGVAADGRFGPVTRAAVSAADKDLLFRDMLLERLQFYDDIVDGRPSQVKFLRGWLKRTLRLRKDTNTEESHA